MTSADTQDRPTGQESLQALVDRIVKPFIHKTHTPGIAISLYLNEQDHFFSFTQPGSGPEITPDTIFGIGSITKVFTATLLASQVVAQVKSLRDSVTKYLPEEVASNPCLARVTLLELATHTSCMPDEAKNVPAASGNLFNDQPPSQQLIDWWKTWKPSPHCDLGKTWGYSNIGFVTLGYAVTGPLGPTGVVQGYNVDLHGTITGPLTMPNTVTHIPQGAAVAQGHKGRDTKPSDTMAPDLKSTARDMLTWLKANLGAPDTAVPAQLRAAMRLAHQVHVRTPEKMKIDMGLGWQIHDKEPDVPPILAKDGGEPEGYTCWIGFIPGQQIGLSVLTNEFWGPGCPYSTPDMAMTLIQALSAHATAATRTQEL